MELKPRSNGTAKVTAVVSPPETPKDGCESNVQVFRTPKSIDCGVLTLASQRPRLSDEGRKATGKEGHNK